jgi:hypothetical protein
MDKLIDFLKRAGWKQSKGPWANRTHRFNLIEEIAPGSWDRSAQPFLAQAILRARASSSSGVEQVAVLKVKRATVLADDRLSQFVAEVAADQSWILCDAEGRVFPHVLSAPELARVAAEQPKPTTAPKAPLKPQSLFTDLNQWMLKVLLAQFLPAALLNAPRGRQLRNATTLAEQAKVSVPAAARFVRNLEAEGQLDTRFGDLRVARPLELLKQWRDQVGHPARQEVAAIAVRGPLHLDVMAGISAALVRPSDERPPIVLGLHSACTELGVGHVVGAVPVVWAPSLDVVALENLGLVAATSGKFDVVLRVPRYPESLYRGVVTPRMSPATDIIQCWLDTSHYRIRAEEQADFVWRTVLKPAFTK